MEKRKMIVLGEVLVLNTIDNLAAKQKVRISRKSCFINEAGVLHIHHKAQFINEGTPSEDYVIPVEVNEDNVLVVDLREVPFAFITSLDHELKNVNYDEWLNTTVVVKKQHDEFDYLSRANLETTLDELDDCITDLKYDEKYHFLVKHLVSKIKVYTKIDELENMINYFQGDYEDVIKKSELSPKEQNKALDYHRMIHGDTQYIVNAAQKRINELQEVTQESLQEELWTAIESQDFDKAIEITDQMKARGWEFTNEREATTN